jgi:nucleotide-binding universal stress UspA family protein
MQHILVPTDFSDTACAALHYAADLAERLGAQITVLHVVFAERIEDELSGLDALAYLSAARDPAGKPPQWDPDAWLSACRARLQALVEPHRRPQTPIATDVVAGRPSAAIVDYARQRAVDLIVMGTHGRGPVARFFIGSVTENVVRSADCPVLLVRSPKRLAGGEPKPAAASDTGGAAHQGKAPA